MSTAASGEGKNKAIAAHQRHNKDVGSSEVQIAIFTKKLEELSKHFETHREDVHSRRGMFRIISKRKRLLEYLKNTDIERYRATISALGLRK